MASRLTIMLVEDNDALREATAMVLRREGHQVLAVPMAEDVDDTPAHAPPDAYVIDLNLPGEDGISLTRRVRAAQPRAIIIMATVRSELADRMQGYATGADAYLQKPVDPEELVAVINACARRLATPPQEPNDQLRLDPRNALVAGPGGSTELTHTEVMLLTALARAPGRRLERWQAMQIVDPEEKGLSTSSLEMRITTVRRKLTSAGASSRPIRAIHGWGYMLCCELQIGD